MRDLALRATRAALEVRRRFRRPLDRALCPYDLVLEMGIHLRFLAVSSLEGLYVSGEAPLIIVNSLRPVGRRAQTCGHELGHHVFGHGDRVDEFRSANNRATGFDPKEYLADRFAMALLMPKLAVERAFARRGWDARTPDAAQVYIVATYLGVGYTTLIAYMERTLALLSSVEAATLRSRTPKELRADIAGTDAPGSVVVADGTWDGRPIDLEIGDLLVLPPQATIRGDAVVPESLRSRCSLRAVAQGSAEVSLTSSLWSCAVRVTSREYQGLARYRHMEGPDVDD